MEKMITFVLSAALTFVLSVFVSPLNYAEAAYHKANQSLNRGGGCQSLSSSTLEEKASPYGQTIASASSKYGVSTDLIKAVITIESCFKPNARGSSGEKGLMQLMPGTARRFEIHDGYNTWQNIHGGTRYLSFLLGHYEGNAQRAVAAYNAGEGNVNPNGRIPNTGYVAKVMHAYNKFTTGDDVVYDPIKAAQTADETVPSLASNAADSVAPTTEQVSEPVREVVQAVSIPATSGNLVKPMKAILRQSSRGSQQIVRPLQVAQMEADKVLPWDDLHAGAAGGHYQVQTGDTVYQVMRETGVSVQRLIKLNRLPAPYSIQAGQTLRLN